VRGLIRQRAAPCTAAAHGGSIDLGRTQEHVETITMDLEEFRRAGHHLVERLAVYLDEAATKPVLPPARVDELHGLFERPLPLAPSALEEVLATLERDVLPHCTQLSSPGYLGLITGSPLPIGALGDLVAAVINQNLCAWTISPAATALERQVVRWLADLVGYGPEAGGHFVSGGMTANLTGLKLARDFASGDRAQLEGVSEACGVYVSEERHISVDKAVDVVGYGRAALRAIPTDGEYAVRLDALEAAIAKDKRERIRPACIVALAGTTNTGSVDDLRALRQIADREGLWLHVDAAYGGGMLLSRRTPGLLAGIELADSVTVDPHKWFFSPIGAGAIVVRDAARLSRSFGLKPAYLTDEFDHGHRRFNYFEHNLEQSKRFRSLKVWLILLRYGARQLGEWVDANVEAVARLRALIDHTPPFQVACAPKMSSICFRFAPVGVAPERLATLHAEVASAVESDGRFWIGTTMLKGATYFRLCAVNLYTRFEHLQELMCLLADECERRL
jgi:aromatic-L-amino-acid decarboxylase